MGGSKSKKTGNPMLQKYKKFYFPGAILILILLAVLFQYSWKVLPFDFALIPLVIAGGYVIWSTAEATFKLKKITAGIMVVLALIGTTYVGEYLAGAIVSFMMIFGEFLEEVTLDKTRNAVKALIKLVPDVARKKIDGEYKEVSLKKIRVGDMLLVKPGERIAVDGVIVSGQAAINEASITGESMPVDKTVDDKVYVGTINENGVLEILAEKIGSDTTLGKIIKTVKLAQENKGDVQKAADKFAKYFTPIILLICAVVWFMTHELMRVMTILVIACPCALVLATPTAVVASVGNAAKRGVLIKGGIALEKAAKITTLCMDKTGTLTEGKPKVVNVKCFNGYSEKDLILTAAIAEKNSQHPLAKAILEYALSKGIKDIPDAEDFNMMFGRGIKVKYENKSVEVSNSKVLQDESLKINKDAADYLKEQESYGRTSLLVIKDGVVIGGLAIADTVRENMKTALELIREAGIKRIIMLTGDNEATARTIAEQVGITEFHANLLPDDKLNIIKDLKSQGESVAMIGDGVNDAPALTLSDIGIAMGAIGTDVAIESSDIALMADDMMMVSETFGLSKRTYGIIKQNIWLFAVIVNVAGVLLSSAGFLSPIAGAIVHNISSVFVVLNSARMLSYTYNKPANAGKSSVAA
ncbi:MAG: heavy metal translocating P-type ATPase [Lutisporaceae bacterium]|jgi:heavy metal translocating P-type ATPase